MAIFTMATFSERQDTCSMNSIEKTRQRQEKKDKKQEAHQEKLRRDAAEKHERLCREATASQKRAAESEQLRKKIDEIFEHKAAARAAERQRRRDCPVYKAMRDAERIEKQEMHERIRQRELEDHQKYVEWELCQKAERDGLAREATERQLQFEKEYAEIGWTALEVTQDTSRNEVERRRALRNEQEAEELRRRDVAARIEREAILRREREAAMREAAEHEIAMREVVEFDVEFL